MSKYDEAWRNLVLQVNSRRYRGVKDNEPMTDRYHWPLEIQYMDEISQAALDFIVASEKRQK